MTDLREKIAAALAYQRRIDLGDDERFGDDGMTSESYWRAITDRERELMSLRADAILALLPQPTDDVKALIDEAKYFVDRWSPGSGDWGQVHLMRKVLTALSTAESAGYARGVEEAARVRDETGWLIERNDLGAPQWLQFGPGYGNTSFSPDAGHGLRFARKCDAERFIAMHEASDPALRATEHVFLVSSIRAPCAGEEVMTSFEDDPNLSEEFKEGIRQFMAEQAPRLSAEEEEVRRLGDRIGYGRLMQAAETVWAKKCSDAGMPGGEHTTGPCGYCMVPCPHVEADAQRRWFDANGHCDWCCGAGRVTKRVAQAMRGKP